MKKPTKIRKKVFIEIECWDCGNDLHRHKTESAALDCIKKTVEKEARAKNNKNYQIRNIKIAKDIVNGKTFALVAEECGISSSRIVDIFKYVLRIMKKPELNLKEYNCTLKEMRMNKDLWLSRIDKVAEFWSI